jgi:sugar phosphate isomerase/epimerase
MQRRAFLVSLAPTLTAAAARLSASRNIKWALSAGLWSYYPESTFTDMLDVMRDTGFIGVRLTGFPGILKAYDLTAAQLEREVSKRNLYVCTISFSGPLNDPAQHRRVVENAREAMRFLQTFGAKHLVVFPPSRVRSGQDVAAAFRAMCTGFNRIGKAANESKVYHRDLSMARFFESIYDLGDGDVDFPACHRILKQIEYRGWICVDNDRTRNGPRASYERCGCYVVDQLESIYA